MSLIGDKPTPTRFRLIVTITSIVVGMYLLLVWLPFRYFRSNLMIAGVIPPREDIVPHSPFQVGLRVANSHWGAGGAYVSLVIDGETEIEGPVIPIPAREERDVVLTVSLETGARSGSLILYDAGYNNRLGTRHGILFRVGSLPVRLVGLSYDSSIRRGDTMTVTLKAAVDDGGRYEIVPIAIVYDSQGRRPEETDGVEHVVSGKRNLLHLTLPTARLLPGKHRLTALIYDPEAKQRIGQNITHNEFVVTDGPR